MKKLTLTLTIAVTLIAFLLTPAFAKKEKITFKSKTVTTFANILDGLDEKDKDVEVWGFLEMPSAGWGKKIEGKVPAIIFVHGAGGINHKRHPQWLKEIRKQKMASFQIDCFKPRGFKKAGAQKQNVTNADMVVDVYMALQVLSNDPRIDKDRIGIMGESKGGLTMLFAMWKPVRDAINVGTFGLHIGLYHISPEFETFEFTGAPILSLLGEKDNFTPSAPAKDLFKKFEEIGYDAKVVIYPGAYHCFDASYDVHATNDYSLEDCRWELEADGDFRELTSGLETYTDKDPFTKCWKKGAKVGQNSKAKSDSKKQFRAFVTRVFKTGN